MATTTPNFGWPVPTSSDLVKNGATAIEGLGDAIDASLLDLKGGTTGQVLAKASNTDMDFSWVVQDDANAIQNTQLTAKGALISAVSAGTPATLTVGTNGQILTADSTTATGLAWATPSAGGATGCTVYSNGTSQSLNGYTTTMIAYGAEIWDSNSYHDNSTNNSRITIPTGKAGKYQINASLSTTGIVTDWILFLFKNGSAVSGVGIYEGKLIRHTVNAEGSCAVLDLAVGDYIQIGFASDLAAGSYNIYSQFSAIYLGA
jgi:hypothetical protein